MCVLDICVPRNFYHNIFLRMCKYFHNILKITKSNNIYTIIHSWYLSITSIMVPTAYSYAIIILIWTYNVYCNNVIYISVNKRIKMGQHAKSLVKRQKRLATDQIRKPTILIIAITKGRYLLFLTRRRNHSSIRYTSIKFYPEYSNLFSFFPLTYN